ncbi:uncharacterized protein [Hetaerina americana]|uniref:uncharacterized protein n=1 Tax=Hetaerina americana TaxID=62018 RepID=UPI003A7F50E4
MSLGDSERFRRREAEVNDHVDDCGPGLEMDPEEEDAVWVFGYGSLCWFPGFEYKDSVLGYVTGFKRRFWQGNAAHRGTAHKPGRVVTVVEDEKEVVWGRAFLVTGDAALPYLSQRECKLGGYATLRTLFHPHQPNSSHTSPRHTRSTKGGDSPSPSDDTQDTPTKEQLFAQNLFASLRLEEEAKKNGTFIPGMKHRPSFANTSPFSIATKFFSDRRSESTDSGFSSPESEPRKARPFPVVMYVAMEDNRYWLGKAPLEAIADQISECHGPSGSNADYLLNLARFMRTEFPSAKDDHLYVLERLVRERLAVRGQRSLAEEAGAAEGSDEAAAAPADAHHFTASLPSTKLRCLNI